MLRARVDVDGIEVAYRQWGTAEGDVVILAHGLPDGAFVWARVAEELEERFRVIAPDLPAFGDTPAPRGFRHTVGSYISVFGGFVDALGIERFTLGAMDIAGAFALPVAAARRERVTALLLADTQVFTGWSWHPLAKAYRTPVVGRAMTLRPPRRRFEKLIRPAFSDDPPRWYVDELWRGWSRPATRSAVMRFYRSNDDRDWAAAEEALPQVRGIPARVVWGEDERFIHRDVADRIGEALEAPVITVLGAGHFPMVERPEVVADAVRALHR